MERIDYSSPRTPENERIIAQASREARGHKLLQAVNIARCRCLGGPTNEEMSEENAWLVNLLIKYGVDVNIRGQRGSTPLIRAAENGYVANIVGILAKEKETDANAQDDKGETALMKAVTFLPPWMEETAIVLLDVRGKTPGEIQGFLY